MSNIQLIKTTPLFQNADEETLKRLTSFAHKKKYEKSRRVFSMGDDASNLFMVFSGWVKLYRISRDGSETIIHVFGPGETFGEAAVFSDHKKYPVHAQAIEEAVLLEIPHQFFMQEIEKDLRFALRMFSALSVRHHFLVQQLEQLSTRTAPQRIGAFLLRFSRKEDEKSNVWLVDLPYDKIVVSQRLNIRPETFSRAVSKLKPHGVRIDKKGNITLNNRELLAKFCDAPEHRF